MASKKGSRCLLKGFLPRLVAMTGSTWEFGIHDEPNLWEGGGKKWARLWWYTFHKVCKRLA